jgi:hypothetical protein
VKTDLSRSGPFIGVSGMATAFFLYAWSALVVRDVTTIVVLPLVWLVLLALTVHWFSTRPYRALAMPFVAVAVWFAVLLA